MTWQTRGGPLAVALCSALGLLGCAAEAPADLSVTFREQPRADRRRPLAKRPLRIPADRSAPYRLVVKFIDGAKVRAPAGVLTSTTRDLRQALEVGSAHGLSFAPLLDLPPAKVESLLERARTRTGRAQPDLFGMHRVVSDGRSLEQLAAAGQALLRLDVVEFAYFEAVAPPNPATDVAPPTPDHVEFQGYRGEAGIDMEGAAADGLDGAGVRLSDVEYNWNVDHEGWNDGSVTLEPGQTIPVDIEFDGAHGTAVAGELIAHGEGYGVTGITPGTPLFVYPQLSNEGGFRRVAAVTSALADSGPGDVVLLELQTTENFTGLLGPAEIEEGVWMATRVGVDAGVVVVAAAGNGSLDLDSEEVVYYRNRGDSGAIIVGAGDPVTRGRLNFSTYGARVDVQGWGELVFTAGYGQFAEYGGDRNQRYTATFSGTSSASPIVAGAAVLLQQLAITTSGPLTSEQMRAVLRATGLPQGPGANIGPLPQVSRGLQAVLVPDLDGPVVSFVTPDADVAVEENVFETDLAVNAEDASNLVTQVQIAIDGELLSVVDTSPPFRFEGVVFPAGTWEVVAFATDVWGNVGESAPLTVAVGIELPDETTGQMGSSTSGDPTAPTGGGETSGDTGGPPPVPPPPDDDDDDDDDESDTDEASARGDDGGCGCTGGAPPASAGWLLLLLCALRRRPRASKLAD